MGRHLHKKSARKGRIDHAIQRAKERYGASYGKKDLQALVHKIQKGKALFLRKESITKSSWLVECYGQVVNHPSLKEEA